MQAILPRKLRFHVAGLLWLVLATNGLAAAPDDQVVELERALLGLAKGIGPPSEKTPDAPSQALQTIVAAGDWNFSLEFAARIANEQSRANALVTILGQDRRAEGSAAGERGDGSGSHACPRDRQ